LVKSDWTFIVGASQKEDSCKCVITT